MSAAARIHEPAHQSRRHRSAMMSAVRTKRVEIEAFAAARARIDAGYRRDAVLAALGVDAADWDALRTCFEAVMQDEERDGRHSTSKRYAAAYAEEWARHAPRFAAATAAAPPPPSEAVTPRAGRRVPKTMISPIVSEGAPKSSPKGTQIMDARDLRPPPATSRSAVHAPPPRHRTSKQGTQIMEAMDAPPDGAALPLTDAWEIEGYVAVCAALAQGGRERDEVLRGLGLTLQGWVAWSARMGQRLTEDAALRARYSRLLHERMSNQETR